MVYAFQEQPNIDLLGDLVNDWNGEGNWNKTSIVRNLLADHQKTNPG